MGSRRDILEGQRRISGTCFLAQVFVDFSQKSGAAIQLLWSKCVALPQNPMENMTKEISIVGSSFRSKNIDIFHKHVSRVVKTFGKRCGLSHYLCAFVTCGILLWVNRFFLQNEMVVFTKKNFSTVVFRSWGFARAALSVMLCSRIFGDLWCFLLSVWKHLAIYWISVLPMFWFFKHFGNINDLRHNHFVRSSFRAGSGSKHRSWSGPALAKQRSFLAAVWSTFHRNWPQTRARRLRRFLCDTPNRFRNLFHQIRSPCCLGHFLPQMVPDSRERTRKFLFGQLSRFSSHESVFTRILSTS